MMNVFVKGAQLYQLVLYDTQMIDISRKNE